jgi:hypothetical protein
MDNVEEDDLEVDDLEDGEDDDAEDEDHDSVYEEVTFDTSDRQIDDESAGPPDARLHPAPSIAAQLNEIRPPFAITAKKSLDTLTQMGFEEEDAFTALRESGWHVGGAVAMLTQTPLSESVNPSSASTKELLSESSHMVGAKSNARAREDLAEALQVKRAEEESLLELDRALSTSPSASGDSSATAATATPSHATAPATVPTTARLSHRLSQRRVRAEEEAGMNKDDPTRMSLPDTWSDSD